MKHRLGAKARPTLLLLTAAVLMPACGDSGSSGSAPAGSTGSTDITVPTIAITAPSTALTFVTTQTPVILAGTAADDTGVVSVSWSNAFNSVSGAADGTTTWTASAHLSPGPNRITLTARDAAGNAASTLIDVVLRPDTLRAWGDNTSGQVGDGSISNRATAVNIPGLPGVKDVAVSARHSLALLADGTVWAWGANESYQLSDNAPIAGSQTPVQVRIAGVALANIIDIAAGEQHSLALRADGTVWAWGSAVSGANNAMGLGGTTQATQPTQIAGFLNVTSLASGRFHSMALKGDGTVWAWGEGSSGQLGLGAFASNAVPAQIPAASFGSVAVRSITCGDNHSAAITGAETLYLWGENGDGQISNGATADVNVPYAPIGGVKQAALGAAHTIILIDSTVPIRACGNNDGGQYGRGNTTPSLFLTSVPNLTEIRSIAAGARHSIFVKTDGTVLAAGDNDAGGAYGSVGDGSLLKRTSPVVVTGLSSVERVVASGYRSIALTADKSALGWGDATLGQLGDGSTPFAMLATPALDFSGCVSANAGSMMTLGVRSDGRVQVVGAGRLDSTVTAALGNGTNNSAARAVFVKDTLNVSDLSGITQVSGGLASCLALAGDGSVYAWGLGFGGVLGNGGSVTTNIPVPVTGLGIGSGVIAVESGIYASFAVLSDGTLRSWGSNISGQLGDPLVVGSRNTPGPVPGVVGCRAVSSGFWHTLALLQNGQVLAWGENFSYQLGDGTNVDRNSPVLVQGLTNAVAVAAGGDAFDLPIYPSPSAISSDTVGHSLALLADGTVRAWGSNSRGQLGDGTKTTRSIPVRVKNLEDVIAVSAGGEHSLALTSDGRVWAWGGNVLGSLGDGSTTDSLLPQQVPLLSNVVAIDAGTFQSVAVLSDGSLRTWGGNVFAQLGHGYFWFRPEPVAVKNLSRIHLVGAGLEHALAADGAGNVKAWGTNNRYQVGDGTTTRRFSPVSVPLPNRPLTLAAGATHSLASYQPAGSSSNTIVAWGGNAYGESLAGTDGDDIEIPSVSTATASAVRALVAGYYESPTDTFRGHSLFISAGGSVSGAGDHTTNQLGLGAVPSPVLAITLQGAYPSPVIALATGTSHTMALTASGQVFTWGGTSPATPTVVGGALAGVGVRSIGAGKDNSFAILQDGSLYAWGANSRGQLGVGDTLSKALPTLVPLALIGANVKAVKVAAGESHTVVLLSDGRAVAFGNNSNGQLGDGTTTDSTTGVFVTGITHGRDVYARGDYTFILE